MPLGPAGRSTLLPVSSAGGPLGATMRALPPALLAGAAAIAATAALGRPSLTVLLGGTLAALALGYLLFSPRLGLKVAGLAVYLGMLDGPVKLLSGAGVAASATRDILIAAVCIGALLQRRAGGGRPGRPPSGGSARFATPEPKGGAGLRLPPFGGWVIAFVAVVLVEAANPRTHNLLKALGGFRQQLEFVPFFFFGYVLMRDAASFRRVFLLIGAIAMLNGVIGAYQSRLAPGQLAAWGPGYATYVNGGKSLGGSDKTLTGRTFAVEGQARVRPLGLGSEEGFAGSLGVLALPGLLALIAARALRRRWVAPLMAVGAVAGIMTSQQRLQVIAAVVTLVAFTFLASAGARQMRRALLALGALLAIAGSIGYAAVSSGGATTFSRYESIAPGAIGNTAVNYREKTLLQIPSVLASNPFGSGLGTAGAAAGFGGSERVEVEGQRASAESEYNLMALELGLPGLVIWVSISGSMIALALSRIRRQPDPEARLALAAIFSSVIAFTLAGFGGPTTAGVVYGPFAWFALGIAAYWLASRPDRAPLAVTPPAAGPAAIAGALA